MGTFRAMGTEVTVRAACEIQSVEQYLTEVATERFVAAEQRFSRFLPESELSRLNRAGAATGVSEALFAALVRAERWSVETNGLFDATLGRELCRLGYDRPFSFGLLDQSDPVAPPNQGDSAVTRRARLTLDRAQRGVVLGPGVELDLGGMIKGATVDEALRGIPLSAAVDAGGDLAVSGSGPDQEGWEVEIEDPFDAERAVATLRIADAAVATSAINRRKWRRAGEALHHLLDPRTLASARSEVVQATVVATSAELAEVLAKALLISGAGPSERVALVEDRADVALAIVVDLERRVRVFHGRAALAVDLSLETLPDAA